MSHVDKVYDDILSRDVRLSEGVYEALVRDCGIDKLSVIMSVPGGEGVGGRTGMASEVLRGLTEEE